MILWYVFVIMLPLLLGTGLKHYVFVYFLLGRTNYMILQCRSVIVDPLHAAITHSNIWCYFDLDFDCWPSKPSQFICCLNYIINHSLVKFHPLVCKIVLTGSTHSQKTHLHKASDAAVVGRGIKRNDLILVNIYLNVYSSSVCWRHLPVVRFEKCTFE